MTIHLSNNYRKCDEYCISMFNVICKLMVSVLLFFPDSVGLYISFLVFSNNPIFIRQDMKSCILFFALLNSQFLPS